jgi:3-deoxy-D-manno-octulosonate 8-phosphate phosphatase (KDO 8-P phosphatase)
MPTEHTFQTVAPRAFSPVLRFPEASLNAARGIRACIFDVDGVLTDGTLYISEAGETLKAFHALDGHGLKLLAQGGITPIVITGRDSPAVRRRLKDLGLVLAVFGAHDKLAAAEPLLAQLGLSWPEVAAMGDDWPDLPLLLRAGLAVAPLNAHAEVRGLAHHTTAVAGGQGAARECCDLLLLANGRYEALMHGHLTTLDTNVPAHTAGTAP